MAGIMDDKRRVIYISGDITEESCLLHRQAILHLDSVSRKPITISINSAGGDAHSCLGLFKTIKRAKSTIITRVDGMAFSSGFILFCAGDIKQMTKYDTLMVHNPRWSTDDGGTHSNDVAEINRLSKFLCGIYAKNSNMTVKQWQEHILDKDVYLTLKDAKKLEIVC